MVKRHISILVQEIVDMIPDHARILVDGTFGHGGHSLAFAQYAQSCEKSYTIRGFDRDSKVLEHGKQYIHDHLTNSSVTFHYINDSYANIPNYLPDQSVDFILLDLGINREHVTDPDRGFSFQGDGPLDMRFDTQTGKTAYELIQTASVDEMARRYRDYADSTEKRAYQIANLVYTHRSQLETTKSLVELLKTIKIGKNELAPIFQAIRIATNNEFGHIDEFIATLDTVLAPGGRCAIISFHSIEDRIIKYHFKALEQSGNYTLLTKHVIKPHRTEIQRNKASRSAKLRVIERKK